MVGVRDGWVVRMSFRIRPKVPRHGSVRRSSRWQRTGRSMQDAPGGKVAMHKAAGRGGDAGGFPVAGRPCPIAMRHGMHPGRGTISPKPQPAGEARASLYLRTTAARIRPRRPASLPTNPRPQRWRAVCHAPRSPGSSRVTTGKGTMRSIVKGAATTTLPAHIESNRARCPPPCAIPLHPIY